MPHMKFIFRIILTTYTGYIRKQRAMSVLNNDSVFLYEVGNDFVINSCDKRHYSEPCHGSVGW
jgi:hypothetical protein